MNSNRPLRAAAPASRQALTAAISIVGLAAGLVGCPAWGTPGDLDPAFGDIGRVTGLPGPAWSVQPQGDGYVVGGGGLLFRRNLDNPRLSTTYTAGFLRWIRQNGLPDDAVTSDVSNSDIFVKDVVVQADGRTLAVGSYSPNAPALSRKSSFTAFRLDESGALDTTFATEGFLRGLIGIERSDAGSVVLDGAGRAVIAGAGDGRLIVVRLTPSGSLDSTFGVDGVFESRLMDNPSAGSIVQVANGFRVTVNERRLLNDGSSVPGCHVVALRDDGQLDMTFGQSGYAALDDSVGTGSRCEASIVQTGGRLVVGGSVKGRGYLVRLLANGTQDSSFQASEVFANMTRATALGSAANGSLLVAGRGEVDDVGALVMRLGVDGALDAAFGKDGKSWLDLPANFGTDAVPHDITVLASGRVLLAGGGDTSFLSRGFLVRLSADNGAGSPGVISMQRAYAVAALGATQVVVTVRRSGGSAGAASVHYAAKSNPDLNHTAAEGVDFLPTRGSLRWSDGDSSDRQIVVRLTGARDYTTAVKTFEVELSDVEGGSGLGTSATRIEVPSRPNIVRLDPLSFSVDESEGTASFNVYLDRSTTGPVSATFTALPGTASEGSDYTFDTRTIDWGDQDAAARAIEVPIVDDGRNEPNETFTVRLSDITGDAEIGTESVVTITINDEAQTTPAEEPPQEPTRPSYTGIGRIDLALLLLGLFCVARLSRLGRATKRPPSSTGHRSNSPERAVLLLAVLLVGLAPAVLSETITIILGTAGNDTLTGTLGADLINGKGGADLMIGLSGDDTYVVNTRGDEVVEQSGEGIDTIQAPANVNPVPLPANVERLVLTGTKDGYGIGNDLANRIIGNSGYNTLDGGAGNDTLTGGAGPDRFRFTTKLNVSTNVDRLTDFDVIQDRIELPWQVFTAFIVSDCAGYLNPTKFHIGASATTAGQRIVYNPVSGALLYDPDGSGTIPPVQFAILPAHLALTGGNFLVFSRYCI